MEQSDLSIYLSVKVRKQATTVRVLTTGDAEGDKSRRRRWRGGGGGGKQAVRHSRRWGRLLGDGEMTATVMVSSTSR